MTSTNQPNSEVDVAKSDDAYRDFKSQNYSAAFKKLLPLAKNGDVEAQCLLANIYHLGLGIEPNGVEAVYWYEQAANHGSALACNNLWSIYGAGMPGIEVSVVKAKSWHEKAKQRGFTHTPDKC